jgi:hypothetical protein
MRRIITLSLFLISLISCEKRHKDATELCGCYTELHRAVAVKKINLIGDSCAYLHVEIIERLKDNYEEMELFEAALMNCQ